MRPEGDVCSGNTVSSSNRCRTEVSGRNDHHRSHYTHRSWHNIFLLAWVVHRSHGSCPWWRFVTTSVSHTRSFIALSPKTSLNRLKPLTTVYAHDDVGKVSESLVCMAVSMLTLHAAAATAADADTCIKNHVSRQSMSTQSAVISPANTFIEIRVSW